MLIAAHSAPLLHRPLGCTAAHSIWNSGASTIPERLWVGGAPRLSGRTKPTGGIRRQRAGRRATTRAEQSSGRRREVASRGAGGSSGGSVTKNLRSSRTSALMNRPLPLIAGLLGVLFLAIAAMYWFVPAGGLPSFFPGFKAGSAHIAVKHAIGSLIIALVLFAFAWLRSRSGASGARI
jgi:hypothetical protein